MHFYNDIKYGNTSLEKIEKNQKQIKSKLNEITTENLKHRSKDQINTIKSIINFFNSIEKVMKLYNGYAKIRFETMHETKHGAELKILTLKQMFQRLPIALAEVKTGNNSQNLLNEIGQVLYSLYQSKEITKKVYNNITKSIKV